MITETCVSDIEPIEYGCCETGIGKVLVANGAAGVRAILLGDDEAMLVRELQNIASTAAIHKNPVMVSALLKQVAAHLSSPGTRLDLTLDLRGSPLQLEVWAALRLIPAGETRSYGAIATSIRSRATPQEVGAACAANVLALAVPCHRVVKADGSISGYRWGVSRKRRLLEREAVS